MGNILCRLKWMLHDALLSVRPKNRASHHISYEVFSLRRELEEKQRDNRYLQFQLAKTRSEKYELERKPFDLRDIIAGTLNESEEQLRKTARFQVRKTESGTEWEVVTGYCCLGGCDMDVRTFPSERDALLFAHLLIDVGYQSPHNVACSACYAEYMKDCI